MAEIDAVVTLAGKQKLIQMWGGLSAFEAIATFKIGEGGWEAHPITAIRSPRSPDESLTDLDILEEVGRAAANKRYMLGSGENHGYFEKALLPGDFAFVGPGTLEVTCDITGGEYNTENTGVLIYDDGGPYVVPSMYEIGLFDAGGVMVAYGTFPKQQVAATTNVVRIKVA